MTTLNVHHRIRTLIEETSDAFSSCGAVNADYAEYATLALSEFKHVLRNPRLTRHQLTQMLRSGMTEHRSGLPSQEGWSSFLARHVAQTSNRDHRSGETL